MNATNSNYEKKRLMNLKYYNKKLIEKANRRISDLEKQLTDSMGTAVNLSGDESILDNSIDFYKILRKTPYFKNRDPDIILLVCLYYIIRKKGYLISLKDAVKSFTKKDIKKKIFSQKRRLYREYYRHFLIELKLPNIVNTIEDNVRKICKVMDMGIEIENKCFEMAERISVWKDLFGCSYRGLATSIVYVILINKGRKVPFNKISRVLCVEKSSTFVNNKIVEEFLEEDEEKARVFEKLDIEMKNYV